MPDENKNRMDEDEILDGMIIDSFTPLTDALERAREENKEEE